MSLPPLSIIPAGAGSGKTHTIQETLGDWVAAERVAPARIVAVTFTESAAAELRERIRSRLLSMGRIEDALELDQAYISTIHGFGLRILTEFAFECGTSPQPRLLNDDEQNRLLRLALARTDRTDAITADLAAFGYGYDRGSGRSAEALFRDDLLCIIELLRSLGWRAASKVYAAEAVAWIGQRYGPTAADGAGLRETLRHSVEALLRAYPACLERECATSAAARKALLADFQNLHRALEKGALERDWRLWQSLRGLRRSKRGSPLPSGYDALAGAVMAAAAQLPRHPGPLAHACAHIEALLAAGQEVLLHYAAAKREAGLVDYSDMIALAGRLLQDRPDVRNALTQRIDCLVVDEFQDTNPLQFALLWQLRQAGVPTLIVGDLKQAIMGFQGADPRLFEALQRRYAQVSKPLTRNWRSQPRLMAFVNALGPGLFGDAYVALRPQSTDSALAPLEVVSFAGQAARDQHAVRAAAVGERLKALLKRGGRQVVDRRTRSHRPLRGGDIAVLCPTNPMLAVYAQVLRAQGLRVRLEAEGWFTSRAVQIAWHALAYLANPADRHAALYLAVTELGSLSLQTALGQLMDGRIEEPLLDRLDALADGVAERTVYALVADTLASLDLFGVVARWPDGEQARANILRLLAEAGEFMDANREALASGGFHGAGVQTFLAWLAARAGDKDGDRQPEPRVLDEDAIVLTTWHSAKGREWPVAAVCGLDRAVKARLPHVELGYRRFDDLSRLLEQARIEYAPAFAAPEANERFLAELQAASETEARRLLYVALTRARDTLMLEWPVYVARRKATSYWSLLKDACAVALEPDGLRVGEQVFPCPVFQGRAALPEDLDLHAAAPPDELPSIGRRAIRPGTAPKDLTPDSRVPSQMPLGGCTAKATTLRLVRYGEGLALDLDLPGTALGSFLHRCFEVLGARPEVAGRLSLITGVDLEPHLGTAIAAAVQRFEAWRSDYFDGASVLREWPLLALDPQGSVISGAADLIVQTPQGAWVIDHKSDRTDDPVQAFYGYRGQLEAYARALSSAGKTVAGIAIHWIRRGEVVLEQLATHTGGRHGA